MPGNSIGFLNSYDLQLHKRYISMYFIMLLITGIDPICFSSAAQSRIGDDEVYIKAIEDVLNSINKQQSINQNDILKAMPGSPKEAIIYYRYDYNNETSSAFQLLNKLIHEKSQTNNKILSKYLEMSQFVDGYFAESYFDRVVSIAKKNNVGFCLEYNNLPIDKVKRLEEIYRNWCR